jgi:hypothetical protein
VAPRTDAACVQTFAGVKQALDAANPDVPGGSSGEDTVLLGKATYADGPFCYSSMDPVTISGEGVSDTTLTRDPASQDCITGVPAVLAVSGSAAARSQVSGLHVQMSISNTGIGLALNQAVARQVAVTGGPEAVAARGVFMLGDASLVRAEISLEGADSAGVVRTTGVTRVSLSKIHAVQGVFNLGGGDTIISSSLITVADADGLQAGLIASGDTPRIDKDGRILVGSSLVAHNVTIHGNGHGNDVGVALQNNTGQTAELELNYSIIDNVGFSLIRLGDGGDATLTSHFSSYPPTVIDAFAGTGTITQENRIDAAPGFMDPKNGDYQLKPTSKLIDAGDTQPLTTFESPLDLAGNPRIVDGHIDDRSCEGRRDIGAYEFQPAAMVADVSAPAGAVTGSPVEFDASASCDPFPDAVLTYDWSFDDGGKAAGVRAAHVFAKPGVHRATLHVSSSTGREATEEVTVNVAAGPIDTLTPAQKVKPKADHRRPRAWRLDVRPHRFRAATAGASIARSIGATVRYRLSEPAKVRFTVLRLQRRHGRLRHVRVRGSFTHRGRRDSNKFRFTGRLAGKRLRPGRYRLVGRPSDSAGNHGKPMRATFRVTAR